MSTTLVHEHVSVTIIHVPEASHGSYGFAKIAGSEPNAQNVFVHTAELQAAGLAPHVIEGVEYVCDVVETGRGLRAVNMGSA